MSQTPLILVTGVSGFVGSNVALHFLQNGYRVRGTARTSKIDELRKTAGAHYPNFEVVPVDDLVTGDYTEALKGVDAVMHVASPLGGNGDPEGMIKLAVEGTLNMLRQAAQKGVGKVILTSSYITMAKYHTDKDGKLICTDEPGKLFNENDWSDVALEEATAKGAHDLMPYITSKVYAERAAWEFAEAHPEIDLTTIHPPFVYGPYAPHFPTLNPHYGTNGNIYALLLGAAGRAPPPLSIASFCDARDVGRAHLAALALPPAPAPRQKRFLVSAGPLLWSDAIRYLARTRPELVDRLPRAEEQAGYEVERIDVSRAKEVLGMEYLLWEKTLDDVVDDLLAFERSQV